MSAEDLREAARVLRERAGAATPGPWTNAHNAHVVDMAIPRPASGAPFAVCYGDGDTPTEENADYIATMHPGVGLAVADWLEDEIPAAVYREGQQSDANATRLREEPFPVYYDKSTEKALAVARLILRKLL